MADIPKNKKGRPIAGAANATSAAQPQAQRAPQSATAQPQQTAKPAAPARHGAQRPTTQAQQAAAQGATTLPQAQGAPQGAAVQPQQTAKPAAPARHGAQRTATQAQQTAVQGATTQPRAQSAPQGAAVQPQQTTKPAAPARHGAQRPAAQAQQTAAQGATTQPQQTAPRSAAPAGQAVAKNAPQKSARAAAPRTATPATRPAATTATAKPSATNPAGQIGAAKPTSASANSNAASSANAKSSAANTAATKPTAAKPRGTKPSAAKSATSKKTTDTTAGAKPARRATSNTTTLHATAVIQLEQLARSMQRGANDAALVQANRATRLPMRLFINALGQMLYRIGQQAEYALLRFGRGVRRACQITAMGAVLLLRTLIHPIGILFAGIWRDLSSPFVHLFQGIANTSAAMRAARKQGKSPFAAGADHVKQGFSAYRRLGAAALSYLLPLAAAAMLCITAWSVLRTPYSLAVTYNDTLLGYVENETVWEDAERKVRNRIQAVNAGDTFEARPTFNVTAIDVAGRTDAAYLANKIISESSDKIQEATGLYVGNTLVGVCTDGASVQQMLDSTLAAANPDEDPASRVEFVNTISQESGLYFTDSITNLAQLESTLQANNWLQTKVIKTETYDAVIAFETTEEESDTYYKGTTRVKQRGVNGAKTVTDDVTYIGGVEVERATLSEVVLQEATPKIVLVGTKTYSYGGGTYDGPISQGSGSLGWPVPGYSYTTTEFGGHRGIDICGPFGTQVLAADGGTVVEAGWHGSFGNYILIDHANGITTRYAHNSTLLVPVGTTVAKGQPIALMGSTGNSSGNHCHFEVTVNGGLVNPRRYITQP